MARRSSANSAGSSRLVLTSLLLLLLRCSEAFFSVRRGGVASGGVRGSYSHGTTTTPIVSRSSTRETGTLQSSTSPTRRDARRERMATLGKVRWQPVQSGHEIATEEAAAAAAALASSRDGFLGSATSSRVGVGSSGGDSSWGGETAVRMGARGLGRGIGRGFGGVRRAVARILGRGGGGKASAAAGASSSTAIGGSGGAAPPSEGALVDVDDVLRHSELLLKGEDEEGSGANKRVLILMSDTGGGHRASAQALKAAFDELYPGAVDVDIVDLWTTHAKWPFNKFVSAYQFMAKRPPIWRAFWEYGRFPLTRQITNEMANFKCHKRFRSMLEEYKPDLVVSVHPLCQEVPIRVMKKMGGGVRKIPFVTVVTDLGGAHPTWFHREVDACFVPSDRLATLAQNCGLSPGQIRLHGLPIRPGFWGENKTTTTTTNSAKTGSKSADANGRSSKAELQEKLGLKPGVKACLVVGGGDGVGGLQGIADSVGQKLGEEKAETQVVVVCGTNDVVKTSLEKGNWASNVHMHVKGFVPNMDEWMGAVDCIVTKAGPGTIAEAMIRGLPIMLSAFLPGQEAGNVPFVTEGGFGSFSRDPAKIADTVSRWLRDDDLLAKMSSKAKEASRPQATYKICSDIGDMLFGTTGGMDAAAAVGKKGPALSVA
ncbi:unnamed protein product [Scytosiphon promiscuus]